MIQRCGNPTFESTIIQELEWHFHTALFTLVLGYGYVNNKHVRVDLVREKLSFRKQVWIEFLGCTFFLIPYCLLVGYFAFEYAFDYSLQTAYADASDDGGTMTNVFGAAKLDAVRFGFGYAELTGQDGSNRPYDTLFSTGHGFQGWTDQFAGTNGGLPLGIVETYLLVGGVAAGINWQLRVHQFQQETESQNYGTETNILFSNNFSENRADRRADGSRCYSGRSNPLAGSPGDPGRSARCGGS